MIKKEKWEMEKTQVSLISNQVMFDGEKSWKWQRWSYYIDEGYNPLVKETTMHLYAPDNVALK